MNIDEIRDWPSDEMTSRGDVTGLVAGVLVALPSGVATALSTLGKNSSGLVGVAISLSLLPPAVNAGLCWTYALLLSAPSVNRNVGDDTNYWVVGSLSLILTLVNIVCKFLVSISHTLRLWPRYGTYTINNSRDRATPLSVFP